MNTTAEQSAKQSEPSVEQLVTFQVGSEEYGFDILDVREIVRHAKVTRIPLSPNYVKGVTNLRGEVLPIIDLRTKFGLEETAASEKSRILVVDQNERQTGLIVDAVHQVTRVQQEQFDRPPESISTGQGRFIKNVARLEGGRRIVMNLAPEKVCEFTIDQSLFQREKSKDGIHSESAPKTNEEHIRVLIFITDGIEYCLPIKSVSEVIRLVEPRRPRNAPDFLTGILSLRDRVLPIVSMRSLFKRRSIESQRTCEIAKKRHKFDSWAEKVERAISDEKITSQLIRECEELASENEDLRSADSDLNHSFDQIRIGIHASLKSFRSILKEPGDEKIKKLRQSILDTNEGFDSCNLSIPQGAKKDQRIIVMNSGPLEIGLQVDVVREVRELSVSSIEQPPSLSKKQVQNLAGVAKFENGKRMVLLLEGDSIIPEEDKQNLSRALREASKNRTDDTTMNTNRAKQVSSDEIQLVCFKIGDDEFGAPIHMIREIDRVSRITPIPDAPPYIEGLSNLRGEVLPIINLRKRFMLSEKQFDDKSRIVVADIGNQKTGLLVDSVSHVLRLSRDVISGPPREISGSTMIEFVTGIAKAEQGKRIIVVIDLERLVKSTDTASLEI